MKTGGTVNLDLSNRVALVTNADCDAGLAVARVLAAEGAFVGLHGNAEAALNESAGTLGTHTPVFSAMATSDAVRELVTRAGRCDIAVAVLPPLPDGNITAVGDDATLYAAWSHVEATADIFHAALPLMQAENWGRLIFVGPVEAKAFTTRSADLDRAVGLAILGMQKALSGEVGAHAITANSVLWESVPPAHSTRADVLDALGATVAYLASPYADFLTGVTIAVDGAAPRGTF
jgi:NAD(P)-dependent dehydrogenase (short-subunit alcohol dehydrogenase family)